MSFEPPRVQTAASDDRAAAQEKEAVGVNGLQDELGGDGRGVWTHPHSLGDLLAEAYARGHGLGESGGDGSLRTIPLVRRAAEESLVANAFASAGRGCSLAGGLAWCCWLPGFAWLPGFQNPAYADRCGAYCVTYWHNRARQSGHAFLKDIYF